MLSRILFSALSLLTIAMTVYSYNNHKIILLKFDILLGKINLLLSVEKISVI